MTDERAPIVQMYNFAPHDVRCLGNSFSDGGGDFLLPRRTLTGVQVAETKSAILIS